MPTRRVSGEYSRGKVPNVVVFSTDVLLPDRSAGRFADRILLRRGFSRTLDRLEDGLPLLEQLLRPGVDRESTLARWLLQYVLRGIVHYLTHEVVLLALVLRCRKAGIRIDVEETIPSISD